MATPRRPPVIDGLAPARQAPGPKPKAAALVARDLAQRVVQRRLAEDERLAGETELAASYGVSRAVMREALRILEWYGLITIRRGAQGGALVNTPSPQVAARYSALVLQAQGTTLRDFDEAMEALDPEVVGLLARRRSAAMLEVLDQALAQARASFDNPTLYMLAVLRFYAVLPELTGNRVLAALGRVLADIRERRQLSALADPVPPSRVQDRRTEALAEHAEVVELIRHGKVQAAQALWRRHLQWTNDILPTVAAVTVLDLFERGITGSDWVMRGGLARRPSRLPTGSAIVAGEIRGRILRGELAEGARLPTEAVLMEHFGFSRATVREGLRLLEVDHLVLPGRGPRRGGAVTAPSVEVAAWQAGLIVQHAGATLHEVLEARLVLERAVAGSLSAGGIRSVRTALGPLVAALASAPPGRPRCDAALRVADAIVDTTPNETLRLLHQLTRPLLRSDATEAVGPRRLRSLGLAAKLQAFHDAADDDDTDGVRSLWASISPALEREARRVIREGDTIDVFSDGLVLTNGYASVGASPVP